MTNYSKFVQDPTLRLLLSKINAFRLGLPPQFRRPAQGLGESGVLDGELVAAMMLTHGLVRRSNQDSDLIRAMLMLGEPLVDKDNWTNEMMRLSLSGIRAILSLLYESEWLEGIVH